MKEMVRPFEVSERTIYRDFAALERRRIPLSWRRGR
jgi:predicted DNA-binding transcriptional regulator YafY